MVEIGMNDFMIGYANAVIIYTYRLSAAFSIFVTFTFFAIAYNMHVHITAPFIVVILLHLQ